MAVLQSNTHPLHANMAIPDAQGYPEKLCPIKIKLDINVVSLEIEVCSSWSGGHQREIVFSGGNVQIQL